MWEESGCFLLFLLSVILGVTEPPPTPYPGNYRVTSLPHPRTHDMNSRQALHPSQVLNLGVLMLRLACPFFMRSDVKDVEDIFATMGTYSSTSSACFLPDLQDKEKLMIRKD